jgi:uncharacterized membrane protein
MSVVGPISGIGAAIVPVIAALLILGERPSALALVGAALAICAVWLVAGGASFALRCHDGIDDALVAGLGFGILFFGLSRAAPQSGLWASATSTVVTAALVWGAGTLSVAPAEIRRRETRRVETGVLVAGLAAAAGAVFYVMASQAGSLVVVAATAALYPGATVALARIFLAETFDLRQRTGLLLAAAAVVALTAG